MIPARIGVGGVERISGILVDAVGAGQGEIRRRFDDDRGLIGGQAGEPVAVGDDRIRARLAINRFIRLMRR